MAVRLPMRLGVIAESERVADSPDRAFVIEPSVGSVARSKGSLYLLVTCTQPGGRAREATRIVAEAIRDLYYYDESAGIRVCLVKAIIAAGKRLAHDRERYGLALDAAGNGPVGVAAAVVRGAELYVVSVGPAEAYLVRQARISTLPDPHRERGLPAAALEPEVWRGDLAIGDSLALISPNVVARLGVDELKDALVTLHPQSAMEHLHNRFVTADGHGSDGAIAFEATEVSATQKQRTLVPVRAPEPLAGAPERSPIPLADSVSDGVAAVQAGAHQARSAARGVFSRALWRLQDLLPRREPRYRRVTTVTTRRENQRRAAVAVISLALLAAAVGVAAFLGTGGQQEGTLSSLTVGQRALQQVQGDLAQVTAPGIDLVVDDPPTAQRLLADAYRQLAVAEAAGIPAVTTTPLRERTVAALDRLFRVVDVAPRVAFTFAGKTPPNLAGLVRGPDGAPYVLDAATKTVYRIDLKAKKAVAVVKAGMATAAGVKVGEPRFIAVGGPDLLVLDAKNVLWRWRPADRKGNGTLTRVKVNGATTWGSDVLAIGTYLRNPDAGLYNLYVVDPSEQQILRYSPAADGNGFPAPSSGYLATAQSVDAVTALLIDGDVFVVDGGAIERYVAGHTGDWRAADPGDEILRPAPSFLLIASATAARTGSLYALDRTNGRVIAYDKGSGEFREQYRLGAAGGWGDVRAMIVDAGKDGDPSTLWWIDAGRLMSASLAASPSGAATETGSPSPSGSPPASRAAGPSAGATGSTAPSSAP